MLTIGNRGRPARPLAKVNANLTRRQDRPLTDAQRAYINHYCTHFSRTAAYRHAHPGVKQSTAESEGSKLGRDPRVSQEIERRLAAMAKASQCSAQRTLDELAKLAFSDVRDYFDANGRFIQLQNLPRHATAALKKIDCEEIRTIDGDGNATVTERTVKVEFWDKLAALKMLGLHYGLFIERVEVAAGGRDFATALRQLRERVITENESGR